MQRKHVIVVGAGPGGLTSAMILAHRGYKVTMLERADRVGGRSAPIHIGPYTFDTGPTFLMMTFILREVFAESDRNLDDYVKLVPLDPMYKLTFKDKEIYPSVNHEKMKEQIQKHFPGDANGLDRFMQKEKVRYEKMYPCLQKPYGTLRSMLASDVVRALPYLSLGKSIYDVLGDYFKDDTLKTSFTFQAKYLGMSPWECPGAFTIIPYIEHAYGIDHVIGGLSRISDAMAQVVREEGGEIHLSTPVDKILVKKGAATGVRLQSGGVLEADAVVINADFGFAMKHLFEPGVIRKWTPRKLEKKKFSCSTFMMYLGLDKLYNEPHHNIIFAGDYKKNIKEVVRGNMLSEDLSVYVRNAAITDQTIAPAGHSALYILAPAPNISSGIVWDESTVNRQRDKVLSIIERTTSMKDIRNHIKAEHIITPDDWSNKHGIFLGATFNLGHSLDQMLYFRPHNKFEEVDNCYLVGGGTHPGSGLPTIYESGRISSNLISQHIPIGAQECTFKSARQILDERSRVA
ncbi:MAG: phytoene desaturase [Chitinivibrionales bacterium]|nr:phytoene desaturase [Chitinivibrionales bacterium]